MAVVIFLQLQQPLVYDLLTNSTDIHIPHQEPGDDGEEEEDHQEDRHAIPGGGDEELHEKHHGDLYINAQKGQAEGEAGCHGDPGDDAADLVQPPEEGGAEQAEAIAGQHQASGKQS